MSSRVVARLIQIELSEWAKKYKISEFEYSQKIIKNTLRLNFKKPKNFSLFAMTWRSYDYQIVDIANEQY
jgi:hypothetical protein